MVFTALRISMFFASVFLGIVLTTYAAEAQVRVKCAGEGQYCSGVSNADLQAFYWGTGTKNAVIFASNGIVIPCDSSNLGTHAYGEVKKCDLLDVPEFQPQTWVHCADQGGYCNLGGLMQGVQYKMARYGFGDKWVYQYVASGFNCGDDHNFGFHFRPDPNATYNYCQIATEFGPPSASAKWTLCGVENEICKGLPGNALNLVRYGAELDMVYRTFEGPQIECTSAAFNTDPLPGHAKFCHYISLAPKAAAPAAVAAAPAIVRGGYWEYLCAPGAKCTITSSEQFTATKQFADSMTDSLKTSVSASLSVSATAYAEVGGDAFGGKAGASMTVSASVTAGVESAVTRARTGTTGSGTTAGETVACEKAVPNDKYMFVWVDTVNVAGIDGNMSMKSCMFVCQADRGPDPAIDPMKVPASSCPSPNQ